MSKYSEEKALRYLMLARQFSYWSKDPSKQVGAVAIGKAGQVLSQGYNGFPRNFDDNKKIFKNKNEKNKYIVHAEMNCIYHATLNGISLQDASLFVYGLHVCHECAKGIIQTGIKEVYSMCIYDISPKWYASFEITANLFKKSSIIHIKY